MTHLGDRIFNRVDHELAEEFINDRDLFMKYTSAMRQVRHIHRVPEHNMTAAICFFFKIISSLFHRLTLSSRQKKCWQEMVLPINPQAIWCLENTFRLVMNAIGVDSASRCETSTMPLAPKA